MPESKRQYSTMFNNMVQGAFFQNADGSLADVNPAALQLFGLTRDQFLERTSCHPDWRMITEEGQNLPPEQHPSMIALKTGKAVRGFIMAIYNPEKKDNIWLRVNAIPLFRDNEKNPYQVFVTVEDISEEKRLEDIRRARHKLLEFSVSHSLDELLVETLNELEKLTGSEIGFYHFYSESKEDIYLKAWSTRTSTKFCHVPGLQTHYPLGKAGIWIDCVKTRKPVVHNDYRSEPHRKGLPEGHAPLIRELVVPIIRKESVVAILGIGNKSTNYNVSDIDTALLFADLAWDIAEAKLKEERLLESEAKLHIIINTTRDGYFVVDANGYLQEANATYSRMSGYAQQELLGMHISELDHLETTNQVTANLARVSEDKPLRFISQHQRKDGSVFDVEVTVQRYVRKDHSFICFLRDVTQQLRAERKLEKSEKQYRDLFEHLPVGFALHEILTDREGNPVDYRFKAVNPGFETLTGLNAAEVVGRKVSDIIPNIEQRWIDVYGKVALSGEPVDFEEYTASMDKYFQVHAYSPEPGFFATLFHDITDRKKAEKLISESQKRLQLVTDNAPVLIAQVDRNLQYKFVNRRYAEFFGTEPREYIGRNARDFLPEDYLNGLMPYLESALNGKLVKFDTDSTTQAGETVTFQTTYVPEFDESGHVIGLIAAIVDITARKKVEAELLRNQYFLTRGQEIGKIGSWEIDIAAHTAISSDEQCRIFGEPVGTTIDYELFLSKLHPEDRDRIAKAWENALQGAEYDVEHRIIVEGKTKWIRSKADFLHDESGSPLSAIGFTQDITEQKEQESKRQQLEAELLQSRKMEALGTLASGMAHNFNNSLAIIMGNLELAQMKSSPLPEIKEHLANAKTALLRSRDLINQIMIYTRSDQKVLTTIILPDLIRETYNLLRPTLPSSIHFNIEVPADLEAISISANDSRIQEALINLCNNAVHAMREKGELTIRIGSVNLSPTELPEHLATQPGNYVSVQVIDTGCGIPDEIKNRIFDPFFTTKDIGEGTGMGLATVRGIVDSHGGFIQLESQVGRGTTITMYFPVTQQAVSEQNNATCLPDGTENVLFIDDEELIAKMGLEMLRHLGYQAVSTTDPEQAIEMIRQNPDRFDLVITDHTMPVMTGKEISRRVKQIRPDLPIILCTGYSQQLSGKTAEQLGIAAFCLKPLEMAEFSQTIRRCLDGKEQEKDQD